MVTEPLLEEIRTFVRERDWERFHDPKNLSMLLASEVGELLALFRWVDNQAIRAKLEVNRKNYPVSASRGTSERPPR